MSRNVKSKNAGKFTTFAETKQGFTLVELLTVISIIVIISTLALLAVPSLKGSRDLTRSAATVAGILEQARSYAMANNTYAWVGFFEEDGSRSSTKPATVGNGGRLVIYVVASQDGTRYSDGTISTAAPAAFGAGDATNTVNLTPINPLVKLDNIRLVATNSGTAASNTPIRPAVAAAYQLGEAPGLPPNNATGPFALHSGCTASNPTAFTYPLKTATSGTPQYTFSKIIEFNPQGEASKIVENVFSGPGPQDELEIALQPTHGSAIDPHYTGAFQSVAAAAIQLEGLSGQVRTFRP